MDPLDLLKAAGSVLTTLAPPGILVGFIIWFAKKFFNGDFVTKVQHDRELAAMTQQHAREVGFLTAELAASRTIEENERHGRMELQTQHNQMVNQYAMIATKTFLAIPQPPQDDGTGATT